MPEKSWKQDFRLKLEDYIDRFVMLGADRNEVLDAIQAEIEPLRQDFARDPDPAEDTPPRDPEPSNDWPGSER